MSSDDDDDWEPAPQPTASKKRKLRDGERSGPSGRGRAGRGKQDLHAVPTFSKDEILSQVRALSRSMSGDASTQQSIAELGLTDALEVLSLCIRVATPQRDAAFALPAPR